MSCERNSNKVSKNGATAAGLTAISNKSGKAIGSLLAGAGKASGQGLEIMDKVADFSNTAGGIAAYMAGVAGPAKAPGRVKRGVGAGGGKVLKAGLGMAASRLVPHTWLVGLAAGGASRLSARAGSDIATLANAKPAGTVTQEKRQLFFFKSKTPVTLWQSGLTGLLNRRDRLTRQKYVESSQGVMFKLKDKTWHRGTSVVKTSRGNRTITHLQSMALPAAHYYFDREVADKDAVGIASGQVEAAAVPGYVGRVSELEGLSTWGAAKTALLKAYLHGGPPPEVKK